MQRHLNISVNVVVQMLMDACCAMIFFARGSVTRFEHGDQPCKLWQLHKLVAWDAASHAFLLHILASSAP